MDLRLPAPCLVVLVGPSGSGKTTWALERFASNEVVSSDALRAMVGAGEDDQTAGAAAFALLEQIVDERLARGMTTVIDTLGYDDEARARWVEKAHEAGMPAHAITFDTPVETCEERNAQRMRSVPKSVLQRQFSRFKRLVPRLEEEEFDHVHRLQPESNEATRINVDETREEAAAVNTSTEKRHTFGLMVSRFDWEDDIGPTLASVARRAEQAGFRDIWVMDHFRQIRGIGRAWEDIPEAYAALGVMAGVTERIRLGALVTGITHRYPIVLGKTIASLDVLSNGRIVCGLGLGWDESEHAAYGIDFPSVATRYEILEETLQMLPLLWGKGTPEFRGHHIESDELICYPRPIQDPIPILVGGGGEKKTLRLVAGYADACNLFGDPDRIRHKIEVLQRHCLDLDRDPAEIEVTHLTNAMAAGDRKSLRERVEALRDRNTTPESYMKRHNAGIVEDLEELFTRYAEAGAGHSIVAIPDVSRAGSVEEFGQVIARFDPT